MRRSAWRIGAAVAGGATLLVRAASADPASAEAAESLYEQGRALLAAGRVAEACVKLAESQQLDPATGTLLNLASCHECEGSIATALVEFAAARERASADGRKDRVVFAEQRISALRPRVINISVDASAAPRGTLVEIDGTALAPSELGTSRPVDPGEHVVRATSAGAPPFEERFTLTIEGSLRVVRVPAFRIGAPAPVSPDSTTPAPPPRRGLGLPLVVLGAGIVVLGAGTYFGLRSFAAWDDRNQGCAAAGCTPAGVHSGDVAKDFALAADITVAVGLVALAAGTYLLVRGLSDGTPAVR